LQQARLSCSMPKATRKPQTRAAPYKKPAAAAAAEAPKVNLFERRPRSLGIGQDIQPKRDVTRFVRWPKYVRLQRQKRILYQRLKVPPAINQFTRTLDKNHATTLFKLLSKYKPETKPEKKARLLKLAEAKAKTVEAAKASDAASKGKAPEAAKPPHVVKYGLNHLTTLIEQQKAALVVIAHDVDPVELVVWLPALCRKMSVPYVIVKGKARLGQLVHKKTATALALTTVNAEDKDVLAQLVNFAKENYIDKYD